MPSRIALDTGQLGGPVGARVNPNPPEPNPTHEADLGFPKASPTPLARAPRRASKGEGGWGEEFHFMWTPPLFSWGR